MTAERLAPADLTIPAPGSTSAREVFSRALPPLLTALAELAARPSGATQAGLAGALRAVRAALVREPGAVWSMLRRPTVSALIRCARATPDAALLAELAATLLVELAVAGALAGELRVPSPPRVVCLAIHRVFELPAGELRGTAGALWHRDQHGRETALWPALATASPSAPGPPRVRVSHLAITPDLALALVDNNPLAPLEGHPDKSGSALDLGGRPVARWIAALREALELLARHMPELLAELEVGLQQVVPVGYDEERHLSASYQEAIGSVYLSLHPRALTMVEALIHEFSHNKLAALLEQGPLLANAFWPLYPSPVRPDPRPLHGVLLAVHAFLPVARLYERMLADREPQSPASGDPQGLRARLAAIVAGNREGAAVLRAHARPTSLGAPLLAEIDRWDRHYEGHG